MHQNDQDSSWTTKDSYDDVPAFKELFERLESDDRDFLAPHPTTGTAVENAVAVRRVHAGRAREGQGD